MIEKKTDDAYQLGAWVGRKQAFAALAGRCSAADTECLRQVHAQRGPPLHSCRTAVGRPHNTRCPFSANPFRLSNGSTVASMPSTGRTVL